MVCFLLGVKNFYILAPVSALLFFIDLQLTPKLFLSWLKLRNLSESENKKILNRIILPLLGRERQKNYFFFFSVKLSREFYILDLPFDKKIIICGVDILSELTEDEITLFTCLIMNVIKSKQYRSRTFLFLILIKIFSPLIVFEFIYRDIEKNYIGKFVRWLGAPFAYQVGKVNRHNFEQFLKLEGINPKLAKSIEPLKYKLEVQDSMREREGILEYLASVLSPLNNRENSHLFVLETHK